MAFLVEENIKDRVRVRRHKETKGGKLHKLPRRALNPRNKHHCFTGDLLSRLNSRWALLKACNWPVSLHTGQFLRTCPDRGKLLLTERETQGCF